MERYPRSLDELIPILNALKYRLKVFLQRNFQRDVHYVELPRVRTERLHGGHNRIDVRLTEEAFELMRNSYNWRNRNIVENIGNTRLVSVIQPVETQTTNFIENCFKSNYTMIRQFPVGIYRVDLYIEGYGIAIECDEFNHADRNPVEEYQREQAIYAAGIQKIIRYNPNADGFCISTVVDSINEAIWSVNVQLENMKKRQTKEDADKPCSDIRYSMNKSIQTDFDPCNAATRPLILDNQVMTNKFDAFLIEHCQLGERYKVSAREITDKYASVTGETNRGVLQGLEDYMQHCPHFFPRVIIERKPMYDVYGFQGLRMKTGSI